MQYMLILLIACKDHYDLPVVSKRESCLEMK